MPAAARNHATLSRNPDERGEVWWDISELRDDQKVPPPRYRHAAPSAPWPWMDFNKDIAHVPVLPHADNSEPWSRYPQSHFGNWTPDQVQRCRMLTICQKKQECQIYKVDVFADGTFDKPEDAQARRVPLDPTSAEEFWKDLQIPLDSNLRVRALFIENITLNVLRILGASYNIEPFFFSSSANWIPSRYQEDPHDGEGDHITVILPFIRVVRRKQEGVRFAPLNDKWDPLERGPPHVTDKDHTIDTQAPLVLSDQSILLQDLLAIHMVRNVKANTIISYHHHSELQRTTAKRLRSLVQRTGDSVYWSKIYDRSKDPSFVFLAVLWYALYAWDEALEVLYAHLSERLEATKAITRFKGDVDTTIHLEHTRELHKVQAHLLYYQQLLRDFRKSVEFVRDTPNPAMDQASITDAERESSQKLLKQESENLLSEIQRLEEQRRIQSDRLENAMKLAFSTVNIEDSKLMQSLTMATLRDSAAMKQISYLTMVFLPASFLSSVFGMNVKGINGPESGVIPTLGTYVESTVILTAITAWVVIAFQNPSSFHPGGDHIVQRVGWPIYYGLELVQRLMKMTKEKLRQQRSIV